MVNVYRRIGLVARLLHVAYGILNAYMYDHNIVTAIVMTLLFVMYEFVELLHDIANGLRPSRVDWPDEELAEYAAGYAVYALLKLLHIL